jgi:eukaryotic-like serine/threonine-protein kinase
VTESRGEVITFYSYKGGTGRTMAVANTGYALARETRGQVLMIDWDLEAPGLPDFFPELSEGNARGEGRAGILELFEDALAFAGERKDLGSEAAQRFWREADIPALVDKTEADGLHLLRSGIVDETYGDRVRSMPWQRLFELWPDLFRAFAEEIADDYRFVLIDSRTGLSDTAGICTSLMPNRLVAVFTPNRQSLRGITDIARRAVVYRGGSSDLRRLLVFPLASRVEMSEDRLRREWRYGPPENEVDGPPENEGYQRRFQRLFEEIYDLSHCDLEDYFDEVQVQHATSYAYGERVAMRDEDSDRLSLSRSYERFTRILVQPEGPWAYERAAPSRVELGDEVGAHQVLDDLDRSRVWHARRARRAKLVDNSILAGVLVVVLGGLGLYLGLSVERELEPPFTPWVVGMLLLVGLLVGARAVLAPHQHFALHARAANALERESILFRARAGPYSEGEGRVALLAERLSRIRAEADDALLNPGGRSLQKTADPDG